MSGIDFAADPSNSKTRMGGSGNKVRCRVRDETDKRAEADPAGSTYRSERRPGADRRIRYGRDWAVGEIVDGALFAPVH